VPKFRFEASGITAPGVGRPASAYRFTGTVEAATEADARDKVQRQETDRQNDVISIDIRTA
jgi:hypothetical protein